MCCSPRRQHGHRPGGVCEPLHRHGAQRRPPANRGHLGAPPGAGKGLLSLCVGQLPTQLLRLVHPDPVSAEGPHPGNAPGDPPGAGEFIIASKECVHYCIYFAMESKNVHFLLYKFMVLSEYDPGAVWLRRLLSHSSHFSKSVQWSGIFPIVDLKVLDWCNLSIGWREFPPLWNMEYASAHVGKKVENPESQHLTVSWKCPPLQGYFIWKALPRVKTIKSESALGGFCPADNFCVILFSM